VKTTYAVIALLDDVSTQAFYNLKNKVSLDIINDYGSIPHITLAVYDKQFDLDGLVEWTKHIAESHQRFNIFYPAIGIMHGYCLIAIPASSTKLFSLHYDIHQKYDEYCIEYNNMKTDSWLPHTGIAYINKETALEKIKPLAEHFQPFEAEIVSLCITSCTKTDDSYSIASVAQFDLKKMKCGEHNKH